MTGRVPNVWAGVIIPMPFAGLALCLRLKARRMTKLGMGFDDALSVAAWILAIAYSIDLLIWVTHYKLGQKLDESQKPYYLEKSRLLLWISEYFYCLSIGFSKLAVLWFYHRVFKISSIKIPIIVVMGAVTIWIILRVFLTLFRCDPIRASWDKQLPHYDCSINATKFYLSTDIVHTLLELIILSLPIFEVLRMNLPPGQKLAVVGLFASGLLVCAVSVTQIISITFWDPNSTQLPYDLAIGMTLGSVETHLAVFACALPLLRPILRKCVPGLSSGRSGVASRSSAAVVQPMEYRPRVRSTAIDEEAQTSVSTSINSTTS